MIEAPPRLLDSAARRSRAWQAGAIAVALALAGVVDPNRPLPFDLCGFRLLTGLPCPTCGITRAVCHALRGHWSQSVAFHPAGVILAVALVGWMTFAAAEAYGGHPIGETARHRLTTVLIGAAVLASLAFWAAQLAGQI